jgi:hypothetical protein
VNLGAIEPPFLLERKFMPQYKILFLRYSGKEIISEVDFHREKPGKEWQLTKPKMISKVPAHLVVQNAQPGQTAILLEPFMDEYVEQDTFSISESDVMFTCKPKKDILDEYKRRTSNIAQPAKKEIIT